MSITELNESREARRINALLDRLDPTPSTCTVPGCTHDHDGAETPPPPRLVAA